MHIAAAVGCPTVAVFGVDAEGDGASPLRLWAPRGPHVHLALSPTKCRVCVEQRFRNRDCLVAGLAVSLIRGDSLEAMLRLGAACGAANASAGLGHVRRADVEALLPRARVARVTPSTSSASKLSPTPSQESRS
jgi:hypothetical protein